MTKPTTTTTPVRTIAVTLSHGPGLKSLRGVPVLVVNFYPKEKISWPAQ